MFIKFLDDFAGTGIQLVFFGGVLDPQQAVQRDANQLASFQPGVPDRQLFQHADLEEREFDAFVFTLDFRAAS